MTDAEQALWPRVRRKQLHGAQFYRQKPLLSFVVDFYCPAAKLIIELDGGQHFEPEYQASDREHDAALSELGLQVLRFDNRQVLLEMDGVLSVIEMRMWERMGVGLNPTNPPFFKGGIGAGLRCGVDWHWSLLN